MDDLPTLAAVESELARKDLSEFVRRLWPVVEPAARLVWTWHLQAICDHLQAVTEGRVRRLLINVPPGHMKSLLVCVFWPAWEWLERPGTRRIFSSHSLPLARRDSRRTRSLVDHHEYQALIPLDPTTGQPAWSMAGTVDSVDLFDNSATGFRQITSVGAKGTGLRAHGVVCDDPLSAQEIASEPALSEAIEWWDGTMSSRLIEMEHGSRVIIMQRLHQNDLSGHVLDKGTYEHLCLPSEYDPSRHCRTSIGFSDPRTEPGELLNPSHFPASVIAEAKIDLGSRGYAGQHDQRPVPAGGALIKIAWTEHRYMRLPEVPGEWSQSWDLKLGSKAKGSSYAVGQVWFRAHGRLGRIYLVDQVRGRWGILEEMQAIRDLSAKWPLATRKLVENKAHGPAVVEMLKEEITGLVLLDLKGGDKVARCEAVLPLWEAGNVLLPDDRIAPWARGFVDEVTGFPGAKNDDQVDAMTQQLNRWRRPAVHTMRHQPVGQSRWAGRGVI